MEGEGRRTAYFAAAGALICAVTFGPYLQGEFVWDDAHIVRDNPSLRDWAGLVRNFTTDTWSAAGHAAGQFYRPLMMLTFWLQKQMGADSVAAYRLVSVLLHLVCGALLFRLLRRFKIGQLIAFSAALLFIAHPVSSEPTMLLAARNDSLGVLFTVSAILAWPSPGQARSGPRRALAALFAVCAFFSKEAFVIAPILIALAQLAAYGNKLRVRDIVWLGVPCVAVLAGVILRRALGVVSASDELERGLLVLLQTGASAIAYYGRLIASLSNGLTFAPYVALDGFWSAFVLVALVLLTGAALMTFVRGGRACRPLGALWLGAVWFALALAPLVLVVPMLGFYQNRYAYFPMIGVVLSAASALELSRDAVRRVTARASLLPWVLRGAAVLLLLGAVAVTRMEASTWRDNLSLYGADVERDPTNGVALYHLGHAVFERRGCAEAIPIYAQAAQHAPDYSRSWKNWAGCLVTLGRFSEALFPAERAVALSPSDAGARFNLAASLIGTGRRQLGIEALKHTLRLDPGHAQARRILADVGADR